MGKTIAGALLVGMTLIGIGFWVDDWRHEYGFHLAITGFSILVVDSVAAAIWLLIEAFK